MKRLLLAPLLLALTSCSNNVTIKTNVGEKILVKSSTVYATKSNKSDLVKLIDKRIQSKEKRIEFDEEQVNSYRRNLYEMNEKCKPRSKEWYLCAESMIPIYQNGLNDSLRYKNKKVNELKIILNDKTVVAETNPELTHKITLSFTPIYIDLNNRKRVGLSETIYCLNPLLNNENQKLPSLWNKYSVDDDKVRLQKGRAFTEICKKFAKFE